MVFLIGNTQKNISFINLVENLIAEYRTISTEHENAVRGINQQHKDRLTENNYTAAFLDRLYSDAVTKENEAFDKKRKPLNEQLRNGVAELKTILLSALNKPGSSPDYAFKISNAIKFVELEGNTITDEALSQIIGDFKNDMDTMKRFRRMVELQIGADNPIIDAYGKTTFPLSFGCLAKYEVFEDELDTLEEMAAGLFVSRMSETDVEIAADGKRLSVPMDSLDELMTEQNIKGVANNCQDMTAALFTAAE